MGRRTLLLIASILVAALGTALIWLYVQGADTRAQAGEVQVPVYVAKTTVEAGTRARDVQLAVKSVPSSWVSPFGNDVITTQSEIKGWTATKLVPGMPLLKDQFQDAPVTPTPPVQLDPRKIAIQLSLPDPQRLAGLLQPGSYIRIYAAVKSSSGKVSTAVVLLPKVKVLASGPVTQANGQNTTTQGTTTQTVPQANVTLEVDNNQALRLVGAQTQDSGDNKLWFGLLGERTPAPDLTNGSAG